MNNEDIKILEEFLNYECTKRLISPCEIQAIENLINRNKKLEKAMDEDLGNIVNLVILKEIYV